VEKRLTVAETVEQIPHVSYVSSVSIIQHIKTIGKLILEDRD